MLIRSLFKTESLSENRYRDLKVKYIIITVQISDLPLTECIYHVEKKNSLFDVFRYMSDNVTAYFTK